VYLTLSGMLRHRVRTARRNAQRFRLPFNLDAKYLLFLWEKQGACCKISGLPFILNDGKHGKQAYRPSIDRIVPRKGYVKGNVRLVATIVNFGINKWGLAEFLTVCKAVNQRGRLLAAPTKKISATPA
jgi:hypothetical protein